jgi:hypothetical protein
LGEARAMANWVSQSVAVQMQAASSLMRMGKISATYTQTTPFHAKEKNACVVISKTIIL